MTVAGISVAIILGGVAVFDGVGEDIVGILGLSVYGVFIWRNRWWKRRPEHSD
jgi:hypothetical protein